MHTTIDIPDTQYCRLEAKAEREGASVVEIVLRGIDRELDSEDVPRKLNRLNEPILKAHAPGSIRLNNVYDLIGFP